eukprot:2478401-Heterocapsa_arctica.AAC.1
MLRGFIIDFNHVQMVQRRLSLFMDVAMCLRSFRLRRRSSCACRMRSHSQNSTHAGCVAYG